MTRAALGAILIPITSAYIVDPPTTASPDTIEDCTSWHDVTAEDTCTSIAESWGLTEVQFFAYVSQLSIDCHIVS
jgi:hypothetical protein